MLGVSESTIRNWVRDGFLRSYRINPRGKIFLRSDDLKRLMGEFEREEYD